MWGQNKGNLSRKFQNAQGGEKGTAQIKGTGQRNLNTSLEQGTISAEDYEKALKSLGNR